MTDEFDPLTGELLPKSSNLAQEKQPTSAPISAGDMAMLDSMNREELINLIRSVSSAIWGYALMDDAHKAEAARLKLYNMGMSSTEVHKVVPALDKWFDRTQGKAPQSIAMTVKDDGLDKISTARLIRLAAMLDEPIIIAPIPSKLIE